MAGESPDRSKQRESSAEPTSGSAGPVPEARSESADPRLAMVRETKKSSARGGVDTATRVLSVRTDEAGRDTGRAGDAEQGEDAAARDAPEQPADASGSGERAGGGAEAGTGSLDGREAAEAAPESAGEASEADARAQEARAAVGGTDAPEAAEAAAEGGVEAEGPEADASEATRAEDEDEDEKGPAASETGQDASGRPVDGDKADAACADAGSGTRATPDSTESTESGDAPKTGGAAGSGKSGAAETGSGTSADARSATEPADAEPTDAKPGTGKAAADQSSTAKTDTGKPTDAKPSDTQPTDTKPSDTQPTDTKPSDTQPATKPADAKPGTAKPDTGASDDGKDAGAPDTGKDGGPHASPPVDQPTAVFKTVRPPVDQPTTMLKLGDRTKDSPKDSPKGTRDAEKDAPEDAPKSAKDSPEHEAPAKAAAKAPAGAEKEAERTSKFVALKPLDEPGTRKPASGDRAGQAVPPADATAPVPTVGPERTTQQPLPPKPPLDLLAELTNTPPPPDTPLRTAVRRVKIWTPPVLLLLIVLAVVQTVRPLPAPTLELTAKDSYTFEGDKVDIPWPTEGQAALDVQGIGSFGSSGEQKPVPIASVAKVMTAYVILRGHPLKSGEKGPEILIDQAAEDQSDAGQESTVDVTKGDKITEREALESILIASANNVARLLARWDAGSEKAFVRKMNDAAQDLGMKNTTYTDPSGLNNTTVSTAVDQVKLAKAAMEQPAFREVAAMMSYVDYKQKRHDNWNRLVGSNNVVGIKTGTTTSALGNLVFAAKKDVDGETRRIVGAVVRQPAGGPDNTILGAALYEGDKLIRAAQDALESATILKKGEVVGYVDDGLGGRTPVAVTEDVTAVGWSGLSVKLTFAPEELPHRAEAGAKVGTLTVGDGSTNAVKVPVALKADLVEPGLGAKLTRLG
ncbi:D-alanyl-D-alanine carboxypeptidase [Streptomyces sp. NPDC058766]|uniref:D-alanyl-D-alanine carboxypeptidase n=1 Tax=Streptomyces sp. NPDC058766 TaxID=3346630 RepID=UPI0036A1E70D